MARTSRTMLALAALLAAPLLAVIQPAVADEGDLTQLGRPPAACVFGGPSDELCTEGHDFDTAYRSVVSKDGRHVYVTAQSSDVITAYSRNTTTGALTPLAGTAGCISETGSDGCADGRGLDGATAVAITDNGAFVYAASAAGAAVAVFARNTTTGELTQPPGAAGCITETGADGCSDGRGLLNAGAITIPADGKSVYVGSNDSDGVAVFSRDLSTGALTQLPGAAGCITETGADGCEDGSGLLGVLGVAASPDGKSVYVTAETSNTVSVFARKTTTTGAPLGTLTRLDGSAGCVSGTGAGGCADGRGIDFANQVVVSPDSKSVYVTSGGGLSVYSRQTTISGGTQGALTQLPGVSGCVSSGGADGCADGAGFGSPQGVAVSPDGRSLYAATSGGFGGVVAFARQTTTTGGLKGKLTQLAGTAACTTDDGGGGCTKGLALSGAVGVTVSPDNRSVYVVTYSFPGSIAVFARQTTTTGGTQGKLTQVGLPPGACISDDGTARRCSDGNALLTPAATAVSKDGKSAYVASEDSDAVAVFARNTTTGALTQLSGTAGCVSNTGAGGCVDGAGLNGPRSVAVSPDGKSVYVASVFSDAVAVFARNTTTGALTQLGNGACVSETGAGLCTVGVGLDGPRSVTVSADNRSVYVASRVGNAVAVFSRQTSLTGGTQGKLTQLPGAAGCLSETGADGCTDVVALNEPNQVTVSPDGGSVYVASLASNAVAVFSRQTTFGGGTLGQLTQLAGGAACVSQSGADGCTDGDALDGVDSVAVSIDGRSVYVSAFTSDAVSVFSRQTTNTGGTRGKLTQLNGTAGCIANTNDDGCTDGNALDGPLSVTVSPDGTSVYVASSTSNAVAILSRQTTTTAGNRGKLTQSSGASGCISDAGTDGCFDGVALQGPAAVTVSANGASVYVTAGFSNAVAAFSRES